MAKYAVATQFSIVEKAGRTVRETSFRLLDYVTARGQLLYYLSIILRRAQFRRPPGEG